MTSFLEGLEQQLVDAVERHEGLATASNPVRTGRTSLRVIALAGAIVFALAAVALAATGVLLAGKPVRATERLTPNAGLGVPAIGRSRLITAAVPDPAGGLPWSMRIVHTTRRLVCLQIGRLYRGQIGVLGEQGAFHDDKRFHPLRADAISPVPRRFASVCLPDVDTVSLQANGVPRSGELPKLGNPLESSQERRLYFGLLGSDAVSVTYRRGRRQITTPVERGTGAYLIVLPSTRRLPRSTEFGGKSGRPWDHGRLVPEGALSAIRYRTASGTCVQSWSARRDRCPQPAAPRRFRRPPPPVELHRPIEVRLRTMPLAAIHTKSGRPLAPSGIRVRRVRYEAIVSFTSPFAVDNALSGYTAAVSAAGCGIGFGLGGLGENVRAGQTAHIHIADVFANACGKSVTISVLYDKHAAGAMLGSREVVVGSTTVARP